MDLDRNGLLSLYKTMTTIRHFEERGIPETGQRGMSASVHSSAGQEAVPTGMCASLTDEDYIGSTHRGHGHCIAKGVDPKLMMAELFGMRSTQVASRKKFLNLPTVKGRLPVSTLEEQRHIYDAWLDSIKIADYRERLLYVARATNLSMSKIYREVQEIEEITNKSTQSKKTKICA